MLRLFFLAVLLLAAAGGTAYWTLVRDDGAEADVQVIRWYDVTVAIPQGSELVAVQSWWDDDRPVVIIGPAKDISLGVTIDAKTGDPIGESRARPEDRAAIDQILQSVTVSALNPSSGPWPYSGEPTMSREKWGNLTFIPPDPAAGFRVGDMEVDGETSLTGLYISNGRSYLTIDVETGEVFSQSVAAEDRDALDRFLAAVQYVGP